MFKERNAINCFMVLQKFPRGNIEGGKMVKTKKSRASQKAKFKKAAKKCKGLKIKNFRKCMSKELKKK